MEAHTKAANLNRINILKTLVQLGEKKTMVQFGHTQKLEICKLRSPQDFYKLEDLGVNFSFCNLQQVAWFGVSALQIYKLEDMGVLDLQI